MSEQIRLAMALPASVAAGEVVMLTMTLENRGDKACYVNARFAAEPERGEIRLTVSHAARELPPRQQIKLMPVSNGDFVLLKPGRRVLAGISLSEVYDLSRPGDYEVHAEYVNEEVPGVLKRMSLFVGRLACTPSRLRVHR